MTIKRSLSIRGHRTSVSIENDFWEAFQDISKRRRNSLASLVAEIDAERATDVNLSSAIRLFVLRDLQNRLREAGSERLDTDT